MKSFNFQEEMSLVPLKDNSFTIEKLTCGYVEIIFNNECFEIFRDFSVYCGYVLISSSFNQKSKDDCLDCIKNFDKIKNEKF